ncbi:sigma factor G inhibitor Gin [Clostridium sp.]|uniref:sigma factor G inhibitor Gin n=1 Tax=Clostridium sp. TaxID=1506 RepID=UPI00260DF69A|nr:sigma factor G inhibitor Gin [Clostridium sp.]
MDISIKDIWRDSKKYCIICEKESKNSGIQIMNSFICEECIQKINVMDVNSKEYDSIKNKVKKAIAPRILDLKDLE